MNAQGRTIVHHNENTQHIRSLIKQRSALTNMMERATLCIVSLSERSLIKLDTSTPNSGYNKWTVGHLSKLTSSGKSWLEGTSVETEGKRGRICQKLSVSGEGARGIKSACAWRVRTSASKYLICQLKKSLATYFCWSFLVGCHTGENDQKIACYSSPRQEMVRSEFRRDAKTVWWGSEGEIEWVMPLVPQRRSAIQPWCPPLFPTNIAAQGSHSSSHEWGWNCADVSGWPHGSIAPCGVSFEAFSYKLRPSQLRMLLPEPFWTRATRKDDQPVSIHVCMSGDYITLWGRAWIWGDF